MRAVFARLPSLFLGMHHRIPLSLCPGVIWLHVLRALALCSLAAVSGPNPNQNVLSPLHWSLTQLQHTTLARRTLYGSPARPDLPRRCLSSLCLRDLHAPCHGTHAQQSPLAPGHPADATAHPSAQRVCASAPRSPSLTRKSDSLRAGSQTQSPCPLAIYSSSLVS